MSRTNEFDTIQEDRVPFLINNASFSELYKCYWKSMFTNSYYLLQDEDAAKECVQEIFRSIWERRGELRITGPVTHYLNRCVKLKVAEHYRNKAIRNKHLNDIRHINDKADHSTESHLRLRDLESEIKNLVAVLPAQCQRVYVLSRDKEMRNIEIAERLTISEKTVKNHLTKALSFLKINLSK